MSTEMVGVSEQERRQNTNGLIFLRPFAEIAVSDGFSSRALRAFLAE